MRRGSSCGESSSQAWLLAGAHVATPNKRAGSGPFERYEKIMAASRKTGARFLYEATAGMSRKEMK